MPSNPITMAVAGEQSVAAALRDAVHAATTLSREVSIKIRGVELLVTYKDTVEGIAIQFLDKLPAAGRK